jgi:hypothetical protein
MVSSFLGKLRRNLGLVVSNCVRLVERVGKSKPVNVSSDTLVTMHNPTPPSLFDLRDPSLRSEAELSSLAIAASCMVCSIHSVQMTHSLIWLLRFYIKSYPYNLRV